MRPSVEERVAYLEGKVEEHSRGFGEIRDLLVHTDGHVLALDQKVDRFRMELGSRIDSVDRKVDRFRDELAGRIDAMDRKVSRQFTWLVAMQIAFMLTVVGALIRG